MPKDGIDQRAREARGAAEPLGRPGQEIARLRAKGGKCDRFLPRQQLTRFFFPGARPRPDPMDAADGPQPAGAHPPEVAHRGRQGGRAD